MRCGRLGAIVFGLALLMQLLVPVLTAQASAAGAIGHMPICSDGSSNDDADGSSTGGVPPHHQHCGLCQAVCGTVGLLGILSVWIALAQPAERRVAAWTLESERKPRFGSDQYEVPRGPPFLA